MEIVSLDGNNSMKMVKKKWINKIKINNDKKTTNNNSPITIIFWINNR